MVAKLADAENKVEFILNNDPDFDKKQACDQSRIKELHKEIQTAHKDHLNLLEFSKKTASEAWLFTKKSDKANVPQPINYTCQGPREKTIIRIKAHDTRCEFRPGER